MAQNHRQALNAYVTITRMGKKATGKNAFALFRMKQKLKELIEFQAEEEQKLVEAHGGTIAEDGTITIKDEDQRIAFSADKAKLYELPVDPEIEPVTVELDGIPEITMDEIEALDGFVTFK